MANSDIVIQNKLKPIVSVFNCAFLYISTPTFVSLLLQVQSTADQHVMSAVRTLNFFMIFSQ